MPDWASRDAKFYSQASVTNMDLEDFDTALTSAPNALANFVTGSPFLTSPEYQKAKVAGDSWIMAVLRPESGAAIGVEEMDNYRKTYLPQPGEDQKTIEYKRQLRDYKTNELSLGIKSVAPNTYAEIQANIDRIREERKTTKADAAANLKEPIVKPDGTPRPQHHDRRRIDAYRKRLAQPGR